jgi:hypothetical protein
MSEDVRTLSIVLQESLYARLEVLAERSMTTVEDMVASLLRDAVGAAEERGELGDQRPEYRALERMRDRFSTGDSSAVLRAIAEEARGFLGREDLPEDLLLAFQWLEFSSTGWAERLEEQGR